MMGSVHSADVRQAFCTLHDWRHLLANYWWIDKNASCPWGPQGMLKYQTRAFT